MRLLLPGCWEASMVMASASFWSALLLGGPSSHVSLRFHMNLLSSVSGSRRSRTLKYGAFFPCGLVSGSHVSGVWVLHVVYGIGFFGRFCAYSGQCLARQWIHVLH